MTDRRRPRHPNRYGRNTGAETESRRSRIAPRLSRRAEIRQTRHTTLMLLYALLGVEIGIALLTSPALTIRQTRVSGLETLPETERTRTLQALAIPRATNWFLTPLHRLRQDANSLPFARNVSVHRYFSRTVTAVVTPRQPFCALKIGSTWYETDTDRVPIRLARPQVAGRLPRVILQQERPVFLGVSINDPALAGSMQILDKMRQETRLHLAKIVIDQSDNICLNMRDGMDFQFGQADDLSAKIALVERIYAKDPAIGRMIASINLTCPSVPACTPRVAQATPPPAGPLTPPGVVTP